VHDRHFTQYFPLRLLLCPFLSHFLSRARGKQVFLTSMLAQLAGAERRSAKLPLASVRRMVVATLGRALDDKEFDELLNEVV